MCLKAGRETAYAIGVWEVQLYAFSYRFWDQLSKKHNMAKWRLKHQLYYWGSNLEGVALELPGNEVLNDPCLLYTPGHKENPKAMLV